MCFVYLALDIALKRSGLVLQNHTLGQPTCARYTHWYSKFGNILLAEWHFILIICAQWCLEQLLAQHRFPCTFSGRFQADLFLVLQMSPSPLLACYLQYQITSFGTTSKARYMKHALPILITSKSEFRSVFKGPVEKFYEFWLPFMMIAGVC